MIHQIINESLLPLGFVCVGKTWRRFEQEIIHVVGLQKSRHDSIFFINLGIFFPQIESIQSPRPEDCHLQIRLDRLHPEPEMLNQVLDLDQNWKADLNEKVGIVKYGFFEAEKLFFSRYGSLDKVMLGMPKMNQSGITVLAPLFYFWQGKK